MAVKAARKLPFLTLSNKGKTHGMLFSQNPKMLVFNSCPSHTATCSSVSQHMNNRFQ